ncbi:hypothetical protein GE09DRAFT_60295 [Coniochaeta sp. 2T2.1]|nr:hypothetical protein GE09DRAFT_60295 [Coniochaeta sp. 2T2.1]
MADPNNVNMPELMRALMEMRVPEHVRAPVHQASRDRGNAPFGVEEDINPPWRPWGGEDGKVWIVDRILEPQTLLHFLEFACTGDLPSGKKTAPATRLLSVAEANDYFSQPYSTWAPASFHPKPESAVGGASIHIGSYEDYARLQTVSKDLHAMKSRIWEGMVPVSERRWRERGCDETENFNVACQLMSGVVNVFHYLNKDKVKADLRETYNLIWARSETFERALNLVRAAAEGEGNKEPVSMTGLWAEFMTDHYEVMVNTAYNWVSEHVDRLRGPVLDRLGSHQPAEPRSGPFPVETVEDFVGPYDRVQWDLTNQLHDLMEIQAHADHSIFLPMDGYKSVPQPAGENQNSVDAQATGMHPLVFTPDRERRRERYVMRLKVLSRENMVQNVMREQMVLYAMTGTRGVVPPLPHNSPARLRATSEEQVQAQKKAGLELRGPKKVVCEGEQKWVRQMRRPGHEMRSWGFVVYRVPVPGVSDEEFGDFKGKFEADAADWGSELKGVEGMRERSRFHWVDAWEHGLDGSIEGLRKHFKTFAESDDFPSRIQDSIFLVADEHSVRSYLNPLPESVPPGDNGPSILAVDDEFDPSDTDHMEESPGFDGQLRILTSLLWDELSVFMERQTYRLMEMWPVAMRHPYGVYTGPVTRVQDGNWRLLQTLKRDSLKMFFSSRDQRP